MEVVYDDVRLHLRLRYLRGKLQDSARWPLLAGSDGSTVCDDDRLHPWLREQLQSLGSLLVLPVGTDGRVGCEDVRLHLGLQFPERKDSEPRLTESLSCRYGWRHCMR